MARVVLTQPAPRVDALAGRLRARGHDTLALAFGRTLERGDDPALREAIARLDRFDWVVLVSPAAVRACARLVAHWPESTGVAVVGPGSRQAIDDAPWPQHAPRRVLSPAHAPFDGAALASLPPLDSPAGLRVLVLRGESGNDEWIERLRDRGATVEVHAAYRHEAVEPCADSLRALRDWFEAASPPSQPLVFAVTQVATVARLEAALAHAGLLGAAHGKTILAIHPRIEAALRAVGWRDVRCIEPGERALVLALESASDGSSRHGG